MSVSLFKAAMMLTAIGAAAAGPRSEPQVSGPRTLPAPGDKPEPLSNPESLAAPMVSRHPSPPGNPGSGVHIAIAGEPFPAHVDEDQGECSHVLPAFPEGSFYLNAERDTKEIRRLLIEVGKCKIVDVPVGIPTSPFLRNRLGLDGDGAFLIGRLQAEWDPGRGVQTKKGATTYNILHHLSGKEPLRQARYAINFADNQQHGDALLVAYSYEDAVAAHQAPAARNCKDYPQPVIECPEESKAAIADLRFKGPVIKIVKNWRAGDGDRYFDLDMFAANIRVKKNGVMKHYALINLKGVEANPPAGFTSRAELPKALEDQGVTVRELTDEDSANLLLVKPGMVLVSRKPRAALAAWFRKEGFHVLVPNHPLGDRFSGAHCYGADGAMAKPEAPNQPFADVRPFDPQPPDKPAKKAKHHAGDDAPRKQPPPKTKSAHHRPR